MLPETARLTQPVIGASHMRTCDADGVAVEFITSNGHAVIMDASDWADLRPLLECGVRLQSKREYRRGRQTIKVVLVEYACGGEPKKTMLLSRAILGASESQEVAMLHGPLDHRRESMELRDAGRRQGWRSGVSGSGSRAQPRYQISTSAGTAPAVTLRLQAITAPAVTPRTTA